MSALTDSRITDRDGAVCWYLQIAGFAWRPFAGAPPPSDADYTDIESIVEVSAGGSDVEPDQGRVRHTPVAVMLAPPDNAQGEAFAQDLRRIRPEGADRQLQLLTTIASTGTAAVEVATSNAAWPATGVFHVDAECFSYTGVAGDGTVGNRYRFTGITRHYRQPASCQTSHLVDEERAQSAWVVSDVVSWRTRPATLYLQLEGGTAWVEWLVGFIDSTPQGDDRGQLRLQIVPWDAALDNEIGGESLVCGLAHGYHLLTVGRADQFYMRQIWREGHAVRERTSQASGQFSQTVYCDTKSYADVFDDGLAADHPRHPDIKVDAGISPDHDNPTVTADDEFTTADPAFPSADIPGPGGAGTLNRSVEVRNVRTEELYTATIDPGAIGDEVLKRWPDDYLAAINSAFSPGTNKGADGVWCDLEITEWLPRFRGPGLSLKLNSTLHKDSVLVVLVSPGVPGRGLAYPLRPVPKDSEVVFERGDDRVKGRIEWGTQVEVGRGRDGGNGRDARAIRPLAEAFYQTGEPVLMLDRLPIATGVATAWSLEWVDEDGAEYSALIRGTVTAAVVDGTTTVGYRLLVEDPDNTPMFGDWPGQPRAILRPAAVWKGADFRRIIVELLVSVEGAGVNGAYDVQPFGLGIPQAAVDVDQILNVAIPAALARWSVTIDKARKVSDVIAEMLQASGYVLQMHLDPVTGARKIRMVQVVRASSVEAMLHLGADEWELDPVPPATDDKVINAWVLHLKAKDGREVTDRWSDTASIRAHRETRSQELDLTGAQIDLATEAASGAAALRSVYGELASAYAWPRRVAAGGVRHPSIVHIDAGDVLTLDSDDLVGYSGREGVSGLAVRIQRCRHDVEHGRSTLTFVYDPAPGTGWNASLYVEAVVSSTKVRVAANEYTETTGPNGETRRDLDFWTVGQSAVMCPRGAWAGLTRTISAINTVNREVTFSAAHGLAVGDSIDPVAYDSAPAAQQALAYQADDALGIGAGPAVAKVYS